MFNTSARERAPIPKPNILEETFANMRTQRWKPKRGFDVWNEIHRSMLNVSTYKAWVEPEEYEEESKASYYYYRSVLLNLNGGKERKQYIAAHISIWKDVEAQVTFLGNDLSVQKIFKK